MVFDFIVQLTTDTAMVKSAKTKIYSHCFRSLVTRLYTHYLSHGDVWVLSAKTVKQKEIICFKSDLK